MKDQKKPATEILIASHSHIMRSGLKRILESQFTIRVLGETDFDKIDTGDTDLQVQPRLVLFDLDPRNDALGAIGTILKRFKNCPILVLCDLADHDMARKVLSLGAHGIALKTQPPGVLIAAIHELCPKYQYKDMKKTASSNAKKSEKPANPEISTGNLQRVYTLTNREREIIRLVGLGLKNKDIASRLSISDITVRHHLTSIFCKLEVADRQNLLIVAHRYGLVDLSLSTESA
jgi:DNA-binding NarL/FixJ family response regulator